MKKSKGDSMKFTIQNVITGKVHRWSIPTILREINRDRSNEWSPYNRRDWKEGLEAFTEFRLMHGKMKEVI